jgi:tetratricopeptide (TPR) repeat protein
MPTGPKRRGVALAMARAASCLASLAILFHAAHADDELAEARTHLAIGRYAEAAARFEPLTGESPTAAIGLARTQRATGERARTERTLAAAAEQFPESAEVAAEQALVALERGEHDAARMAAEKALTLQSDCLAARWVQAQLFTASGRMDEAARAWSWFAEHMRRSPTIARSEDRVLLARGLAEHARWTRNSTLFRRLVGEILPATSRNDPNCWQARLVAAELFLEKFNEPDAATEITAALAINPQAAELHAARGAMALASFDLATARTAIDRALEINPKLLEARLLRGDWLLADVRPAEAAEQFEQARRLNPRSEETLGRLLAAYSALDGRPEGKNSPRVQALIDEMTMRNPHCGRFYLAAGEACDRMRRFPLAAEFYRLADERMPQLIAPRGHLGLVLMRLGEEQEAARLLTESFAIDPFNVRVKNQLEVLDVLSGYAVLETEHFVLKFDRGQSELLARYAAQYLEDEAYPDLTERLGFAPPGKTLIEIFTRHGNTPGHNWFSARMVGLPLIGTVGACAGKMVALSSPEELPNKYDWAQVLRHELVHVINLQQTDFNVPHWFTEGLAVYLEEEQRPREWTDLLRRRQQAGTLFTLEDVTLGFIRPQSKDDWTLAYCQSELYIEHLIARFGDDAPRRMLAAYAERKSTGEALAELFAVSEADFEKSYRAFVAVESAKAGGGTAVRPGLAELQKRLAENPQDAELIGQLARAWLDRDDKPQARNLAIRARQLNAKQADAAYVLARLQVSIGDLEGAVGLLDPVLDRQQPHEESLALLAALKLQAKDAEAAGSLYVLGEAKLPHTDRWTKGLAKIYLQNGDGERLRPVLKRWLAGEPDNLTLRSKLAELALAAKDFAEAAEFARKSIHADVRDAGAHVRLAEALVGMGKYEAAVKEYETALSLDSSQADWQAGLVSAQLAAAENDVASRAAFRKAAETSLRRLRELNSEHPQIPDFEKRLAK